MNAHTLHPFTVFVALTLGAGCNPVKRDNYTDRDSWIVGLTAEMQQRVRPGALVLGHGDLDPSRLPGENLVRTWRLANGTYLAQTAGGSAWIDRVGRVHPLTIEPDACAVSIGDSLYVDDTILHADGTTVPVVWPDPSRKGIFERAYRYFGGPMCNHVASSGNRVRWFENNLNTFDVCWAIIDEQTGTASRSCQPGTAGEAQTEWHGMYGSLGVQAPLRLVNGSGTFEAPAELPTPRLDIQSIIEESPTSLLILDPSGEKVWRWNVSGGNEVEVAFTASASPDGFPGWSSASGFGDAVAMRTHPATIAEAPAIPDGFATRRFVLPDVTSSTAGDLPMLDLPLTPCSTAEACRLAGESYLIGVTGKKNREVGIYAVWTWMGENKAIYVAMPLHGDPTLFECGEGDGRCTLQNGRPVRQGCTADTGRWIEDPCPDAAPICSGAGVCGPCQGSGDCFFAGNSECEIAACLPSGECGHTPRPENTPCGVADETGWVQAGACNDAGECIVEGSCSVGQTRCVERDLYFCDQYSVWEMADPVCSLPCTDNACGTATDLAPGGDRGCALLSSGEWSCHAGWIDVGFNPAGEGCGVTAAGVVECTSTITVPTGLPAAAMVRVNDVARCLVTADHQEVWCWGENSHGELGDGTTSGQGPVKVTGIPTGIATIAATASQTCVATQDGAVWCWGPDGLNASNAPHAISGITHAEQLSLGSLSACALELDGSVRCWGKGTGGRLGNDGTTDSASAVLVAGGHTFIDLALGWNDACALANDGTVWCWGVGDMYIFTEWASHPSPVQITGLSGVTAITLQVGGLALVDGGATVMQWGYRSSSNYAPERTSL